MRKEYYLKNKEKVNNKCKEYYNLNRNKIIEHKKEYYETNKDKIKMNNQKHKEERKAYNKEYAKNHTEQIKQYYQDNKENLSIKAKQYYIDNKTSISKKCKEYRDRIKDLVFNHYGGYKCVCCNETIKEFMTIDHINGGGNQHRKELGVGAKMYNWLYKNNYPHGFRVLCMNCNFSLGKYGYCPHSDIKIWLLSA